jgi:hypothetical protein
LQLRVGPGAERNRRYSKRVASGDNGNKYHRRRWPRFSSTSSPVLKWFLLTPAQRAQTAIYLGTSPEEEGVTGKYFIDEKEKSLVPISYDMTLQERIWKASKDLCHLT